MSPPPFQAFTIRAPTRLSQIVTRIRVVAGFDPSRPPEPLPVGWETTALWDTGASKSVISQELAKHLELIPVGAVNVNHAGGTRRSLTYIVNFMLPHQVGLAGVLVTEFPAPADGFQVIVGMDVICHGDFSITNVDDKTCVSFRTPSCATIDYVQQHQDVALATVGRNDPCPCGKMKSTGQPVKFKHCHGAR